MRKLRNESRWAFSKACVGGAGETLEYRIRSKQTGKRSQRPGEGRAVRGLLGSTGFVGAYTESDVSPMPRLATLDRRKCDILPHLL